MQFVPQRGGPACRPHLPAGPAGQETGLGGGHKAQVELAGRAHQAHVTQSKFYVLGCLKTVSAACPDYSPARIFRTLDDALWLQFLNTTSRRLYCLELLTAEREEEGRGREGGEVEEGGVSSSVLSSLSSSRSDLCPSTTVRRLRRDNPWDLGLKQLFALGSNNTTKLGRDNRRHKFVLGRVNSLSPAK